MEVRDGDQQQERAARGLDNPRGNGAPPLIAEREALGFFGCKRCVADGRVPPVSFTTASLAIGYWLLATGSRLVANSR
ncbi:MAG: hypothetical protein NTW87_15050 [Planctomycetota bacterium]|nr:hypothetical protein [Planctomycetota bacterium]